MLHYYRYFRNILLDNTILPLELFSKPDIY